MKSEGGGGSTGKTATGLTLLSEKPLSPEKVAAYSFEFPDYKVHFDPDLAASIGLRAPIAQGAMSVSWIAGEIAKGGAIDTLDMSVTFRQPIFWDEHVKVYAQDAENFAIANSADEICSMGNLQSVTYQA